MPKVTDSNGKITIIIVSVSCYQHTMQFIFKGIPRGKNLVFMLLLKLLSKKNYCKNSGDPKNSECYNFTFVGKNY